MFKTQYSSHVSEVQSRWESELEAAGFDAALIHSGTPLVSFLDDYEYPFRPNPQFLWWLPLTHHHDSVLLVRPGEKPRLFFHQPDDYWHTPPSDPDSWWADEFEIEVVRGAEDWKSAAKNLMNGRTAAIGDSPALRDVFDDRVINPERLTSGIHVERTRKTAYEIECMKEATRLAVGAHIAAESAFEDGKSELQIHMAYLDACGHTDASLPYHNIVALNEHGAVLHYQGRNHVAPGDSRSFLIDAGCTFHAYCSDITRTYSSESGLFSEMISAMDQLQKDLVEKVRDGLDYRELHLDAHHAISGVLSSFGIITVTADDAVESGLSSVFYPHGLGHFIGLQTHDVAGLIDNEGNPIDRPEGHPFLRLTRRLESGNVLTIEPGLYFIEPLLRRWKSEGEAGMIDWNKVSALMPYGGIRIEDNVVVQTGGCANLTREAFASAKA